MHVVHDMCLDKLKSTMLTDHYGFKLITFIINIESYFKLNFNGRSFFQHCIK